MLGKIIKYDIKATYPWILLMDAATILLGIIVYATMGVLESNAESTAFDVMMSVISLAFSAALVASMVLTFVVPTLHFHKSMFGDEGYLTNTLPVKPSTIIIGKGLVFALWNLVNGLVIFLVAMGAGLGTAAVYEDGTEIAREELWSLADSLSYVTQISPAIPVYTVAYIVFAALCSVMLVYACLALGSLFRSHRLLWSALIGIVSVNVIQVLSVIILAAFADVQSEFIIDEGEITNSLELGRSIYETATPYLNLGLVLSAVAVVVLFIITERIVSKKLNLL